MNNEVIVIAVEEAWDLPTITSCEKVDSYNSGVYRLHSEDGKAFFMKLRSNCEVVERESELLAWLSVAGVPTAPPLATRCGKPYAMRNDSVYALYPQLPGDVTDDHYSPGCTDRAYSYGVGIARLHSAMTHYPKSHDYRRFDIAAEVASSVKDAVRLHGAELQTRVVLETMEYVTGCLGRYQYTLPTQLIHRDIHPANMLTTDDVVTGFLDFDLSCVGFRIFDPCYCLTSMLISEFYNIELRTTWPSLVTSLLSGYNSISKLDEVECKAILPILLAIELLFINFSCASGHYDAARCNEAAMVWLIENKSIIEEAANAAPRHTH